MNAIHAVVFDVGETLIDESRIWTNWADRLAIPRLTLLGVLGAMAAGGRAHREAFEIIRPGLDVDAESWRWAVDEPDALRNNFDADDLYPDVRRAFTDLRAVGLRVVIAANQPPEAGEALRAMRLGAEQVLISDDLGVHKPHPEFFTTVATAVDLAPEQIAYVGDRVDFDVIPASDAGMVPILVRRGPWGYLHAGWPEASRAAHIVDTLTEIAGLLSRRRS